MQRVIQVDDQIAAGAFAGADAGMPHEVISGLDKLIAILKSSRAHLVLSLKDDKAAKKEKVA